MAVITLRVSGLKENDHRSHPALMEELMGNTGITIQKQPVNVATCQEFNDYMRTTGWLDSKGVQHPNWAGGTEYPMIKFNVTHPAPTSKTVSAPSSLP